MNLRKSHLSAAVGAALLVGGTAAQAQVTNAQQGIQVQLYGQVSRAMMFADDGHRVSGSMWTVSRAARASASMPRARSSRPARRRPDRNRNEVESVQHRGLRSANSAAPGREHGNLRAERWLDAFVEGSWGRVNMGQGSELRTTSPPSTCPAPTCRTERARRTGAAASPSAPAPAAPRPARWLARPAWATATTSSRA